jgi:SAM-dependent methyltransferase
MVKEDPISLTNQKTEWKSYWNSLLDKSIQYNRDVWYIIDQIKFQHLKKLLPKKGKTLEVGCGLARLSSFLAADGYDTFGLDCICEAIAIARSMHDHSSTRISFVVGDGFHLPFDGGSFDVVLSTGLLEHFLDPGPIVMEMVRVLVPGGLFYSDIVPKKFSLLRSLDSLRFSSLRRKDVVFERKFKMEEIINLLQNNGLIGVVVFPAGVFLPRIPLIEKYKIVKNMQSCLARVLKPLSVKLDHTFVSQLLGLYYFAYGYKRN